MNAETSKAGKTVWAFDLGKGSIGEAVRCGDKFLHKASLLIPPSLRKPKPPLDDAVCGARGRHTRRASNG